MSAQMPQKVYSPTFKAPTRILRRGAAGRVAGEPEWVSAAPAVAVSSVLRLIIVVGIPGVEGIGATSACRPARILLSRGGDEDVWLPGGWYYRLASCSSTYVRDRLISAVTAVVLSRMGIPRGTGCMKISVHPW